VVRYCQRCLDDYGIETVLETHRFEMCIRCMRTADADADLGTCLFPDDHAQGHPASMRFHVRRIGEPFEWEDLTEAEIAEGLANGHHYQFSSQFDWWFSP
jgi:hypothetical protein